MRQLIQLFGQLLAPTAQRFNRALNNPRSTQELVQQDICDRLIQSEYGKSLGIQSVEDWQRVPIVDYDQLEPCILGEQNSKRKRIPLTPEPILFYEKTSGSSGAVKWIPYTRSLRKSFNQMFCVWAHDLIQNGPKFSTGKLYACISPQLNSPNSKPENSLSLQDDLDYLDAWLRWLLRPWLVMPEKLEHLHNAQSFKHQLSLALLQAEKLEIVSIWSPSFLQIHLNYIQENKELLREELQRKISDERLQILAEPQIPWTQLWSNLKLISCWDAANAADGAKGLRSQFPDVLVQGKGLLATEAPMTIPLIEANGYVPVLDEVFFEFEDDRGSLHGLHELSIGQVYTIILSQKGGLYRYRIGDRVLAIGMYRHTPCLEFLGRHEAISDLVGEKLQESFVRHILDRLNLQEASFKSLVPVANPPHYILLLDRAKETPEILAQHLDIALSESTQYHRARLLDQLAPPQVFISPKIPELLALYHVRSGSIWGGIKHPILATSPINAALFSELKFRLQSNN
ncbi:GH3 family domain-containing protein [Argonema galeatum]|uniref:GH3 family domain-containing protein n=1 Tax=Argonema galeatum TaxID=2942762 RepID=UPI002011A6F4|nr:GH3 auxin-responsive promoter family protein [Argonema galeatum]MCL1463111.1 GH3 auxin-responsive promoter family protein [Argonema galeatum A003/A1]